MNKDRSKLIKDIRAKLESARENIKQYRAYCNHSNDDLMMASAMEDIIEAVDMSLDAGTIGILDTLNVLRMEDKETKG